MTLAETIAAGAAATGGVVLAAAGAYKLLDKLRLFRVRRHYRSIARLEARAKSSDARNELGDLRLTFAAETFKAIDGVSKRDGMARQQRRQRQRTLAAGKKPEARVAGGNPPPVNV